MRNNTRFDKTKLTERQLKSFDAMYRDLSYSMSDICDRFKMSPGTIATFAKERGLPLRSGRPRIFCRGR